MLIPIYTKQFQRDIKRAKKRNKDTDKLKIVMTILINEEKLSQKYHNHKLTGNYSDNMECHIEPNWLLIYKLEEKSIILIFCRPGKIKL